MLIFDHGVTCINQRLHGTTRHMEIERNYPKTLDILKKQKWVMKVSHPTTEILNWPIRARNTKQLVIQDRLQRGACPDCQLVTRIPLISKPELNGDNYRYSVLPFISSPQ